MNTFKIIIRDQTTGWFVDPHGNLQFTSCPRSKDVVVTTEYNDYHNGKCTLMVEIVKCHNLSTAHFEKRRLQRKYKVTHVPTPTSYVNGY